MTYWVACYTDVAAEKRARDGIEALDRGTFLPTFAKIYSVGARRKAFERPILNRYLLVALNGRDDEAWSQIKHVEGVHDVLTNFGVPCRVSDQEVIRLMLAHAMGDYNTIQPRAVSGRYRRSKRRRARPRAGKKARSTTYIIDGNTNAIQQAS